MLQEQVQSGMLTNYQLEELAKRMRIPLEFCGFKDELPKKLKANRAYIINMDDSIDEKTGKESEGTHWTCFQFVKHPNGKEQSIYFDSFGAPPPQVVSQRMQSSFGLKYLPNTTKNIQSMMAYACGWYCLAFLHFINAYSGRSCDLYRDTEEFLACFDDLADSVDFKKNEYVLKMFFQAEDPRLRREIDVISNTNSITQGDADALEVSDL